VLYIESPVGVGFSYSDTKDYKCNDDRTATENTEAVNLFFKLYPEYLNNKFFITGESYAGVYVPTLAESILNGENDGTYTGAKLVGIAVGNGCSGTEVGICGSGPQGIFYEWSYLLQTAFIDKNLKLKVNDVCDWPAAAKNIPGALSFACISLLSQASSVIQNVNMYDIYGDCVNDSGCSHGPNSRLQCNKVPERQPYVVTEPSMVAGGGPGQVRSLARITPVGLEACIDSGVASHYLNDPAVIEAIHVKAPDCWSVCGTAPRLDV